MLNFIVQDGIVMVQLHMQQKMVAVLFISSFLYMI